MLKTCLISAIWLVLSLGLAGCVISFGGEADRAGISGVLDTVEGHVSDLRDAQGADGAGMCEAAVHCRVTWADWSDSYYGGGKVTNVRLVVRNLSGEEIHTEPAKWAFIPLETSRRAETATEGRPALLLMGAYDVVGGSERVILGPREEWDPAWGKEHQLTSCITQASFPQKQDALGEITWTSPPSIKWTPPGDVRIAKDETVHFHMIYRSCYVKKARYEVSIQKGTSTVRFSIDLVQR
jgi:hypothetical protein